jgi:hypothetical protein
VLRASRIRDDSIASLLVSTQLVAQSSARYTNVPGAERT